MYSLYFDGASRSNPGHASFGGVIYKNNKEYITYSKYIGVNTNNVAEYMGCLAGIRVALNNDIKSLTVYGDSMLVVNQLNKNWKVKSDKLKKIYDEINKFTSQFDFIEFKHVYRTNNKKADSLANEALDQQGI
jgi:ribonuclease HI